MQQHDSYTNLIREYNSTTMGKEFITNTTVSIMEPKSQAESELQSKNISSLADEIRKLNDHVSTIEESLKKDHAKLSKLKEEFKKKTEEELTPAGEMKMHLGLQMKKHENLPEWYSEMLSKGEMIDYCDESSCYILHPWSLSIWDIIKKFFERKMKKLNVDDCCYFPILTNSTLEKQKILTSSNSDSVEMYQTYAKVMKWLKLHKHLPLKFNQWNNVVRSEYDHPQPFLCNKEFLWQEGHTAFATKEEAVEEVSRILELYAQIYENYLAIPVMKGCKTDKEKFAGGDSTTTIEVFIPANGRVIQGATIHHLGQNFSKKLNIQIGNAVKGKSREDYVYQNSWYLTTRIIGIMMMVHGDDKGLVLPPMVASIQAIIVPCGITASTTQEQRKKLLKACRKLEDTLSEDGTIRVQGDYRDNYDPGWKFCHWALKGVPVRVQLGLDDLKRDQVTFARRDTGERIAVNRSNAYVSLLELLDQIQYDLLEKAKTELNERTKQTHNWTEFCNYLNSKNIILAPFCGRITCEENINADSIREDTGDNSNTLSMGAKSICVPFNELYGSAKKMKTLKCIHPKCQSKPKFYTLFGYTY